MNIAQFQKKILDWYKKNRRDLPWRNTKDPYKILVSEIMLQQTQISRVLPKYEEFLKAFPTLEALARSSNKKLLKVWTGLGYWRRAKFLKETAKILTKGKFPQNPKELEKLPGIGPYTARAVACFAFNHCEPFLDTNIRRVYLHFFFQDKQNVSDKEILKIAQNCLKRSFKQREWHYALFDYGAIVLKNKKINKRSQHYHKQSKFEGSFRSFRTKAVRFLLSQPGSRAPKRVLANFLKKELQQSNAPYVPKDIVAALVKDKLIKQSQTFYSL